MSTRSLITRRTGKLEVTAHRVSSTPSVLEAIKLAPRLMDLARRLPDEVWALETLIQDRSDALSTYIAIDALRNAPMDSVSELLVGLLGDADPAVRHHAAWALSHRKPAPAATEHLVAMTKDGGFSKMMAELALENWIAVRPEIAMTIEPLLAERLQRHRASRKTERQSDGPRSGLNIAQILVQGRVDPELTSAASGDGGGLITLQVGLTRELATHPDVSRAHLITRAFTDKTGAFRNETQKVRTGGFINRIAFGPDHYLARNEMWEHRSELERGLERELVSEGPFDVVHLRFADVGTFSASRVAERLGIPVVFTLAPDPHSVIAAREKDGTLSRDTFEVAEESEHLLFRAWLVEDMLQRAEHVALLPRPRHREQFQQLMDVDVSSPRRFTVVAEGADLRTIDSQRAVPHEQSTTSGVLADLRRRIGEMPEHRQGLPLLLTAGRLSPVKGVDRVVEAWGRDSRIHSEFNLVILGGDLANPSEEERSVLLGINDLRENPPGLLMMGGRSHREVLQVMSAVRYGIEGLIAPNGAYVCGSAKEEFGLAIVEALASGLAVVAPREGGPATYIEHGFTGYLAETLDVEDIRKGIRWADIARRSEIRAEEARRLIKSDYSLSAMASNLVSIYQLDRARTSAS